MMKIRVLFVLAVTMVVASCSDDKSGTDDSTPDSVAPTTTVAPATVAPTTGAPTTTTPDPVALRVAVAEEIAGTYVGEWSNTTFGSTGSIDAQFSVDAANATASLTMDLGGNVFGASNPDPFVAEFDLNEAGPYAGTNAVFGEFTVTLDEAFHLKLTAVAVPGVGGKQMIVEGDFADGAFSGTYEIVGLAVGTFEAART
ncbi:MAG: hypothetical protein HY826_08270 [Actinobacteria bacterium]|nr:hypothetical protein [Actinomycetota bacterium]